MARTQAADYDQRRKRIVDEAARLYARNGFLGATVSDLADACQISKSAIYHYYPSKEDILFDVMHSYIVSLDEAAMRITATGGTPEVQLRELAHAFMHLYVGAADRHKVLLNALKHLPKARAASIVALQRRLIATVEHALIEIEPRLAKRSGLSRPAAMLFFGMINWTHTWFDPRGAMSADALADMAVDLTLGGISKIV